MSAARCASRPCTHPAPLCGTPCPQKHIACVATATPPCAVAMVPPEWTDQDVLAAKANVRCRVCGCVGCRR